MDKTDWGKIGAIVTIFAFLWTVGESLLRSPTIFHKPIFGAIRKYAKKWLWIPCTWALGELVKHRVFSWANDQIDKQAGEHTIPQGLVLISGWAISHPVELFAGFAALYCLAVVYKASITSSVPLDNISSELPSTKPPFGATDPDLQIEYHNNNNRELLILTARARRAEIRAIHPLISEVKYRSERELILLKTTFPVLEVNQPVECRMSGVKHDKSGTVSLDHVLEAGGPMTSDSVFVEYTDSEENAFSKNFFLYKNSDGSVVWREKPQKKEAFGDLAELQNMSLSAARKLEAWESAWKTFAIADEMGRLLHELARLKEAASSTGPGWFDKVMETPMKRVTPVCEGANSGEKITMFMFQQKFTDLNIRLRSVLPQSVSLDIFTIREGTDFSYKFVEDALTRAIAYVNDLSRRQVI